MESFRVRLNSVVYYKCSLLALGGKVKEERISLLINAGLLDKKCWPLIPLLPSYGYGREHREPCYGSLIHGPNLKDVVITGKEPRVVGPAMPSAELLAAAAKLTDTQAQLRSYISTFKDMT